MHRDSYKTPRPRKRNAGSAASTHRHGFTSSSFRTRSSSMSTTKADRAPKLTKSNKYERSKICQNIRQLKLGKRVIANFKTVVTTFGKDPPARTLGDSVWNGNESKADESLVKYEETARVCCPAIVRFLGKPSFAKGEWVGVELMRPIGKHDGSVNGIRYFQAENNCGLFVKPRSIHLCQADGTFGGIRWEELEDMRLDSIHMKMVLLRPSSPKTESSRKTPHQAHTHNSTRRIPTRNRQSAATPSSSSRHRRAQAPPQRKPHGINSQKASRKKASQQLAWSDDEQDHDSDHDNDEDYGDDYDYSKSASHRRTPRGASRSGMPHSAARSWSPSGLSAASRLDSRVQHHLRDRSVEPQYRKGTRGSHTTTTDHIPVRKLPQWQLEERQELWDWMRGRNLIAAPDVSSHTTPLPHYEHLYAPASNCQLFHALLKVGVSSVPQLRAANLWNLVKSGAINQDDAGRIVQAFLIDPKKTPPPVARQRTRFVGTTGARTASPTRRSTTQAKVLGTSTLRSRTPYRTPRSYASNRLLSSTAPVGFASELTPFRTPVNTPSTYAPPRALSSTAPLMGNYTSAPPTDALRRCVNCHGELDAHIAGHAFPTSCNDCKNNVREGECVYR